MEDTLHEARASPHTLCAASPALPMQASCVHAALVLLHTTKRLRNARKQVGSLTLGALTLSLSLSPHAATPAPRPQEIPQGSCDVRMPSPRRLRAFVGMVWSTNNKDQFRLGNKCGQDVYLGLIACDPWLLSSSLGAPPSELLHFLRVRSAGLETKR